MATSLGQSVAHLTFTHSQIYNANFQPTIELLLKSTKKLEPPKKEEKRLIKPPEAFEDPLVVFDHDLRKVRKTSPKDGIFYYLCTRPSVVHEARNRDFVRPRKLRFLICITISSQNRDEYENTIFGIYQNLKAFKSIGVCNEDIAVIVFIDGCLKMDASMKEFLRLEDRMKGIDHKKTLYFRSKVFESPHKYPEFSDFPRDSIYMYQMSVKPQGADKESKDNYLNVFLCTKLEPSGKLGSHMWFFRGFCEMFNPEYCCLIEGGTKPNSNAIYEFFKAMEVDHQIGAVCGYISLYIEPTVDEFGTRMDEDSYKKTDVLSKLCFQFFDLQKAQVFEYAFEHILDRSFESFFGFSHVLPSVFSAYRWDALKGAEKSILDEYLRCLIDIDYVTNENFTLEKANMHLAEDRILSLEIFSRKNYIIKYIPESIAWTTASKYLLKLMEQRRIVINSSWFAMNYLTGVCWQKVLDSQHTTLRLLTFYVLMGHSLINMLLFYFSISFYCIILHLVSIEFLAPYYYVGNANNNMIASASGTIVFAYLVFVSSILFCSLIYKSKEGIGQFQMATTILGIFNFFCVGFFSYLIFCLLILKSDSVVYKAVVYTDEIDRTWDFTNTLYISNIFYLQILGLIAAFSYLCPLILNPRKSLLDVLFSLKDYFFYFPMYIHTLLIYAFCNIDDLSGGSKILKSNANLLAISQKYKIQYVYRWISLNMLVTYVLIIVNTDPIYKNYFILVITFVFTANLAFKALFAIINHLKFYLYEKFYYNYKLKQRILEYTSRSKDLLKYIENIKKTLNQQSMMNFSAVSIQYEDNTKNNRTIEKEKRIEIKMEVSNLGVVVEEEDSKGSHSHNSSGNNEQNQLSDRQDNHNNQNENQNNNELKVSPFSPTKTKRPSVFSKNYKNNFGTNTKQLKIDAKLNSSGNYQRLIDKEKMIIDNPMESINFDLKNEGKNLDLAFEKQNKD